MSDDQETLRKVCEEQGLWEGTSLSGLLLHLKNNHDAAIGMYKLAYEKQAKAAGGLRHALEELHHGWDAELQATPPMHIVDGIMDPAGRRYANDLATLLEREF